MPAISRLSFCRAVAALIGRDSPLAQSSHEARAQSPSSRARFRADYGAEGHLPGGGLADAERGARLAESCVFAGAQDADYAASSHLIRCAVSGFGKRQDLGRSCRCSAGSFCPSRC